MLVAIFTGLLSLVLIVVAPHSAAQEATEGKALYATYCSGCHGGSGKGDGPAARTLSAKPADHTRVAMRNHSDQYLADIISKGGTSVGKSSSMPAWNGVLKEPQISAIVSYIRDLSSRQKEAGKQGPAK